MPICFSYKTRENPVPSAMMLSSHSPKKRRYQIGQWELAKPKSQKTLYFSIGWFARALRGVQGLQSDMASLQLARFRSGMRWTRVKKGLLGGDSTPNHTLQMIDFWNAGCSGRRYWSMGYQAEWRLSIHIPSLSPASPADAQHLAWTKSPSP